MNIDKYNEAIRQKLESVEPTFEESDWAEMQSFMALKAPKISFWGQHGRLFLYSAGTLILLTSLFFNLKQKYDYTSLLDTHRILLQRVNSQESKRIYQTDTVYLTKYITVKQSIKIPADEQASDENVVFLQSDHINPVTIKVPEKEIKDRPSKLNNEEPGKPTQADMTQIRKSESKSIEPENQDKNNLPELLKKTETDQTISEVIIGSKIDSITQTEPIGLSKDNRVGIYAINSIPINQRMYLWNKQSPTIKYSSAFAENLSAQKKRKRMNFSSISLDHLNYRIGISLNAGSEEVGGSLLGEVLLNKHWSINAGIKVLNVGGGSYFTAEQYEYDTKQDFRKLYAPFVPLSNDILNIDFQHYLLQIPLGITYRYPLRNDFTLLFSTTTDLNICGRQMINFDYKEDSRKFDQGNAHDKISINVLNNIEFSAGLEKKLNRMVFQAYPYLSTSLRETSYKRDELILGAKLRFFVNLGK
ncbi:hypothetical protein [Emticicia sp. TH156]|uniref:hypothetical protein n=1 Tax=Emticicia sp. TH156 TaxID=2067454 RepID=UPI000C766903|nr:hypothetical protein [Emticicia sp. TH156]PLK44936.1 hypothetical protein C0V77_06735 [Emticicia sp. TH156]